MNTNKSKLRMPRAMTKLIAIAAMLISSGSCAQSYSDVDDPAEIRTRTVLITGANRGIGLELARQYSAAGWHVIGTARRPDAAAELQDLRVRVMQLDVTDHESVARLAQNFGDQSIDVLINNAGILQTVTTVADINFDDFNRTLAVNAVGPIRVTQVLLPNLRAGELKKVINISSILGSIAENNTGGFYGYRESKAALNIFTRSLAGELRSEGFICIVLHPGWVQTDMGGASAPVPVQESVFGIRDVIESVGPADNGTFWNYRGEKVPW